MITVKDGSVVIVFGRVNVLVDTFYKKLESEGYVGFEDNITV